jgi:hypothetical protein
MNTFGSCLLVDGKNPEIVPRNGEWGVGNILKNKDTQSTTVYPSPALSF